MEDLYPYRTLTATEKKKITLFQKKVKKYFAKHSPNLDVYCNPPTMGGDTFEIRIVFIIDKAEAYCRQGISFDEIPLLMRSPEKFKIRMEKIIINIIRAFCETLREYISDSFRVDIKGNIIR